MNDQPWIDGFWTDRARAALPNLAWAIDEIPKNATLDELCVELEVIAGAPSIQTRTVLLQGISDWLAAPGMRPLSAVIELGKGSSRLAMWCLLSLVEASVAMFTPTAKRGLAEMRDWCSGRGSDEAFDRSFEAISSEINTDRVSDTLQRQSQLVLSLMILAQRLNLYEATGFSYPIQTFISMCADRLGVAFIDTTTVMMRAMQRAVMLYPVSET